MGRRSFFWGGAGLGGSPRPLRIPDIDVVEIRSLNEAVFVRTRQAAFLSFIGHLGAIKRSDVIAQTQRPVNAAPRFSR